MSGVIVMPEHILSCHPYVSSSFLGISGEDEDILLYYELSYIEDTDETPPNDGVNTKGICGLR